MEFVLLFFLLVQSLPALKRRKNHQADNFLKRICWGGIKFGSNELKFSKKFTSASCREIPHVNSPYSHWSYSKCRQAPIELNETYLSIPGSDAVTVTHYEAEFFYERLESITFQFFRDEYSRVYDGLEALLGTPAKKKSERISGMLGPTINKNKTTIWRQPNYSIKLQSRPGGGSISFMQFYTNAYLHRLKEPYEKYLKDNPEDGSINRKHFVNKIKTLDTDY